MTHERARWSDEVFDITIFVVSSPDLRGFREWLIETCGPGYDMDVTVRPMARTIDIDHQDGRFIAFWFRDVVDITDPSWLAIVAHETQHGAHMVLGHRGVKCCSESEEAFCYYAAYLFRHVFKHLRADSKAAA